MNNRYVVEVCGKGISPVSVHYKSFDDEKSMLDYIELKTRAGMTCHQFNYNASFSRESILIKNSLKDE